MKTATCVLLTTSTVLVAGACSLAALNGYATGGGGGPGGPGGGGGLGGGDAGPDVATCVGTDSDPANCGACGVTCAAGYACTAGVCENAVVDVSTFLATCAVLRAGEVWCWGRDVWGEIAITPSDPGNTTCYGGDSCRTTPAKVVGLPAPSVDPAVEVSAGREATCGRTSSGAVYCWGSNDAGMLGHDPTTDVPTCTKATSGTPPTGSCSATPQPVALPAGTVATQIALGSVTACALTMTKDVYCWGSNASAEEAAAPSLALGWSPKLVASGVDQVAVGADINGQYDAVCVRLTTSGNVECWGDSAGGALFPAPFNGACDAGGDSYCTPNKTLVPTVFSPPSGVPVTAEALSVGVAAGVALEDGGVTVWGSNQYGQSGIVSQPPDAGHFNPRALSLPIAATAVSAPGLTTLLLDARATVWALGWSDEGQIGNGKITNGTCPNKGQQCQNQPVSLQAPTNVAKIRGGLYSSAAITQNGKLWMWGANYAASLGHAPGTQGDQSCGGTPAAPVACNPTPAVVTGLP